MKYSVDIVGPLPTTPSQLKYMLALTDYFSKWVEVAVFSEVKEEHVESFVWRNIICRYGILKEIVTDKGSQFVAKKFKNFYSAWKIHLSFLTPRNLQGNRQAEETNKTIMNNLKKKLEAHKEKWAEELPAVL